MNFLQLQNKIFEEGLGYHEAGQKCDWQRQAIRDAVNEVQMELARLRPNLWGLTDETTMSLVAGTSAYFINDWCMRPISFYTTDQAAHKVKFRYPQNADRDGSRNSSLVFAQFGPWQLTWKPKNIIGTKSGTGAALAEAGTAVSGLSGLGVASAYVGRLLRINGDDNDYKIVTHTDTTAVIDQAHRGVLSGLGTTGAAAAYSGKRWEVGPIGQYQLQILPTPTDAVTLYVRYARRPRRLIQDDAIPEIPEEFHNVIWRGALSKLSFANKDSILYQAGVSELEAMKRELMAHDDAELFDEDDAANYYSSLVETIQQVPGVYQRGDY